MEPQFRKLAGLCLLIGALLATLTMMLHPLGGAMDEIARKRSVFGFSHGIALFCLPVMAFGQWGLSVHLQTKNRVSMLAFCFSAFGLIGAFIAGTLNGLVLPAFSAKYYEAGGDQSALYAIIDYGFLINQYLSYAFIAGSVLSIATWSALLLAKRQPGSWLGLLGLLILAIGMIGVFSGFQFLSVHGFRIFIFSLSAWYILAGWQMIRYKQASA